MIRCSGWIGVMLAFSIGMVLPGRALQQITKPEPGKPSVLTATPAPVPLQGLDGTFNPLRTQEKMLVRRGDVQRELSINARQREQIEALFANAQGQLINQRLSALANNRDLLRQLHEATLGAGAAANPGERRAIIFDKNGQGRSLSGAVSGISLETMQQMTKQLQEIEDTSQQQEQKQLDTILTPAQRKRLKELDLQWRGIFALLDKPVGERLPLSETLHDKIDTAWNQYKERLKQIDDGFKPQATAFVQQGGNLSRNEGFMAIVERERRLNRKARFLAEVEANQLIPYLQRQQWYVLTGTMFAFREHDEVTDMLLPR